MIAPPMRLKRFLSLEMIESFPKFDTVTLSLFSLFKNGIDMSFFFFFFFEKKKKKN
jgi:hypothetical protein